MRSVVLAILGCALVGAAEAVQVNGGHQTTEPTNTQVANWTTGWDADASITGWDYVGQVNSASGVYLGNGWVLTAAHVGAGTFSLNGLSYTFVGNSGTALTSPGGGESDLYLFRLNDAPPLPAVTIRSSAPVPASYDAGSQVVMLGYGGGSGLTWGANTVTHVNQAVTVNGRPTLAFATQLGSFTYYAANGNRSRTVTNSALLVGGDSGGAGFLYNSTASRWELAGINSAVGTGTGGTQFNVLVQLDQYAPQLLALTAVPEGATTGALVAAFLLLLLAGRKFRRPAKEIS